MILTLITVGKIVLEARSKGKTTDALKEPDEACAKNSDHCKEMGRTTVPIEQVKKGDIFVRTPW